MPQPLTLILIDGNFDSRGNTKFVLDRFNNIKMIGDYDNLVSAYDAVIREKPNIVFIDLSENQELGIETIEKIVSKNKSCVILVTSDTVDTDLVIKSMRAGAREFLTKPVAPEDISLALKKARSFIEAGDGETLGQIISIFSNKGGIGKTTIATNLALKLSEITDKRVCLVDLNLQIGDITTFLDVTPSFDIAYICTHLSRIDESFLLSSLEKYKNKDLYILADPPNVEQAEEISAEDIASILGMLREIFPYVVVDTSSGFDIKTLTCLDMSDHIMLVSIVSLTAIRNCQRCLDLFQRLEYDTEKVKLIINRHSADDQISVKDVEDALDRPVYWTIPNSYFTVVSSINKGMPISKIAPGSPIDECFTELAGKISDTPLLHRATGYDDDDDDEGLLSPILNTIKSLNIFKKGE